MLTRYGRLRFMFDVNPAYDPSIYEKVTGHKPLEDRKIGKIVTDKGSFSELPFLSLSPLLEVRKFGKAKGYKTLAFENWTSKSEIKDAIFRHLLDSMSNENDKESNLNHMAHVCFNAMIYLHNDAKGLLK